MLVAAPQQFLTRFALCICHQLIDCFLVILETPLLFSFSGRMELFRGFINTYEELVKKIAAFCKAIPGFNSLSCEDRVSLLKSKWRSFTGIRQCLQRILTLGKAFP